MELSLLLGGLQPLEKVLLTRRGDDPFQSYRFFDGNLAAHSGKAVIAPPLVVLFHGRTMPALLNRAVNQKALDNGIQGPSAKAHVAIRLFFNFLQDGVAMLLAIS